MLSLAERSFANASPQFEDDISILASTEEKLVLKYRPNWIGVSILSASSSRDILFEIENCTYAADSSRINLPIRRLLIPLGSHSVATAQIIQAANQILATDDLPSKVGFYSAKYLRSIHPSKQIPDPNTSTVSSALWDNLIRLGPPAQIRDQRVCELTIYPIYPIHTQNVFSICTEMVIEVRFQREQTSEFDAVQGNSTFDGIFPGLLTGKKTGVQTFSALPGKMKKGAKSAKRWYRISILEEGIYRLSSEHLIQAGLSQDDLSSGKLHLYYGGGRELSTQLDVASPGLREIPTLFVDNDNNGFLDHSDGLIFFAQGTSGWEFENNAWRHYVNHYTEENIYWLCIEDKPRLPILQRSCDPLRAKTFMGIREFRDHVFTEQERSLPNNSGLDWMWDVLRNNERKRFPIEIHDPAGMDSARLEVRLQGLTETHHQVELLLDDHLLKSIDLAYLLGMTITCDIPNGWLAGEHTLSINLSGNNSSIGFDWYELEYSRSLQAIEDQLRFFSTGRQGWTKFEITGFSERPIILDVADPFAVETLEIAEWDSSFGRVSILDSIAVEGEKQYWAISPDKITEVEKIEPIPYDPEEHLKSGAMAADYLIIAHESLQGAALDRLLVHRSDISKEQQASNFQAMSVTTREIYDQFSNGLVDPVAIRNFLRYTLLHWQKAPSYVLLVGDATFDFKDNLGLGKQLLIPSYENRNQVSDDWFVNLTNDRLPDMMIGRLPVSSQEELAVVVDKIIQYESKPLPGAWRSRILLAADDLYRKQDYAAEDHLFLKDSEALANSGSSEDFDVAKVYLEQYPWDRSFNKPSAKAAFLDNLNSGALFVNFFGHANWNMLAHESLFRVPNDLPNLHNANMLPVFYAGTCEIALIDDPRLSSMAELLLSQPEGGVVAVIGSARWNMHLASYRVAQAFYECLFAPERRGVVTIGQALLHAKIKAGYPDQTEIMFLLGDPALTVLAPSYHIDLAIEPDTLSLDKRTRVRGKIYQAEAPAKQFSGQCLLRLYDSGVAVEKPVYNYLWPGRIIFEGQTSVDSGEFDMSFFADADTSKGGGFARLAACAWQSPNETNSSASLHAIGAMDSLYLRSDSLVITNRDTISPQLSISLAGRSVQSNDAKVKVALPFVLAGHLADDKSGLAQVQRSDWGIQVKLDNKPIDGFAQTASLQFDDSTFRNASFSYPVKDWPPGDHHLSITLWDDALNSTQWDLDILVVASDLTISQVMNYPNPAFGRTFFTFVLDQEARVKVKIYTVAGRCIRTLEGTGEFGFNKFPETGWGCTDEDGDAIANGVYLYKVIAESDESSAINLSGKRNAEAIGKLIIAN